MRNGLKMVKKGKKRRKEGGIEDREREGAGEGGASGEKGIDRAMEV